MAVVSELTARFDLPVGVEAPAAARHAITSMLRGWGLVDENWLNGVQVVVSELVTNAVVHGGGCLSLDLSAHEGVVTVGAADGTSVLPRRRESDDTGGRGLRLIELL